VQKAAQPASTVDGHAGRFKKTEGDTMLSHCRKNNAYTSDHHSFYYRRQQAIVYNFLERPHGLAAAAYHITVCVRELCKIVLNHTE
jgi:hypothetical protein